VRPFRSKTGLILCVSLSSVVFLLLLAELICRRNEVGRMMQSFSSAESSHLMRGKGVGYVCRPGCYTISTTYGSSYQATIGADHNRVTRTWGGGLRIP